MEENEWLKKIIRKYFMAIELVLLLFALMALGMLYNHTPGGALLLVILLSALACWYLLKASTVDQQQAFKVRIMYFGFAVSCIAVLFALLQWPGHKIHLVAGLACMAAGWGVFLWTKQRSQNQHQHQPATSYMMFLRLVLYTAACLTLLLSLQEI